MNFVCGWYKNVVLITAKMQKTSILIQIGAATGSVGIESQLSAHKDPWHHPSGGASSMNERNQWHNVRVYDSDRPYS